MLSTMAGRVSHLEEKLERQRETRGAHSLREAGLARKEREARREQLRQRTRELAAARDLRDTARAAAERGRRAGDQTLLTYLLPATCLAFGVGVLLASGDEGGAPSSFLIDALWRVPLHDLVYGACARRAAKAAAAASAAAAAAAASVKVVVHEPRRIAGAAVEGAGAGKGGGGPWPVVLQWLAASLLPGGGAVEMSACYVRHTVYLLLGLVAAALLHYLMGGMGCVFFFSLWPPFLCAAGSEDVGRHAPTSRPTNPTNTILHTTHTNTNQRLGQHRAKLHVAMLAYAFQRHILRVTWRGLRSLRHLLLLHALLWLASATLDAGYAFSHRRLWLRGVVPALLLAVALYDAALYVDSERPMLALVLMIRHAWACLTGGWWEEEL
jgi:hypothetical protein